MTSPKAEQTTDSPSISLRAPEATDGPAVFDLIARCPPLDQNSRYCNLLQCLHFADTCVAAFLEHRLVGFISGYIKPGSSDTYFLWQVAVDDVARGQGLGRRMLTHLFQREHLSAVRFLETTITPDNKASWALFESFARRHEAALQSSVLFERGAHFDNAHDDENLLRIGPFSLK